MRSIIEDENNENQQNYNNRPNDNELNNPTKQILYKVATSLKFEILETNKDTKNDTLSKEDFLHYIDIKEAGFNKNCYNEKDI